MTRFSGVHQPGGDGPELLRGDPDPAVAHGGRRGRELPGQHADRVGRHAASGRHPLGRVARGDRPEPIEAVGEVGQPPGSVQLLGEEDVEEAQEEAGVPARAHRDVPVGHGGGLGPARVHHHETPSPRPQRGEPVGDPGGGHQAAVRGDGVGPQHEQEAGPVDVGHREEELVPEHLERREHLRQLVHRGGREAGATSQRPGEERDAQDGPVAVHGGVAHVHAHRVAPVPALEVGDPVGRLGERVVPGDRFPAVPHPPHRLADPQGVAHHVGDGGRLGADVAAAERVVPVTPDAGDAAALELHGDAAGRLAQHAGVEADLGHGPFLPEDLLQRPPDRVGDLHRTGGAPIDEDVDDRPGGAGRVVPGGEEPHPVPDRARPDSVHS